MKNWQVITAAAVGIAVLCGLGSWQIFRMNEKALQVAQLEKHFNEPAIDLTEALGRAAKGENIEYLKVEAKGTINPAGSIHKLATRRGMPAFEIIRPLITSDGNLLLVDDGMAYDAGAGATSGPTPGSRARPSPAPGRRYP